MDYTALVGINVRDTDLVASRVIEVNTFKIVYAGGGAISWLASTPKKSVSILSTSPRCSRAISALFAYGYAIDAYGYLPSAYMLIRFIYST